MGETAKLINRHIAGLEPGQLFTTRDCLPFGSRAAIDQKLYRLVKAGVLVRFARGVFARRCSGKAKPTAMEVASKKAASFGRRIAAHAATIADELGLMKAELDTKIVFATDSSSSTFKYGDITVYLRKACWRKMSLQKSKAGKALVALWHIGKYDHNIEQIEKATAGFGPVDKMQLRESAPWIPVWLSVYFLGLQFNAIRRQVVVL